MSETSTSESQSVPGKRQRWRVFITLLGAIGLGACGWAWLSDRWYKRAMEEIESDVMAGRYAIASRNLEKLLSWKSDPNGGITYLLGSCELARGRIEAAREAWARVAPASAFYERAIRGRMRLLNESGQLAEAERLVYAAAADRRNDKTAMLVMLVPVFSGLGRLDEAKALIEDRWEHLNARDEGALEPAINLLRLHIELTLIATLIESQRAFVDQAARRAPEDDRVWLGRANLAIRRGEYDEAGRWLDACEQRRPDDFAVWRARLNWGVASNRSDVVEHAMKQPGATLLAPTEVHRLNAWLAAKRGQVAAERWELQRLLVVDPEDLTTIDRLIQLAEKESRPVEADELRGQRRQIVEIRSRYQKLHERKQPIRDAQEMARLAKQLGRKFEARAFLTIAIAEDPDRADLKRELARLNRRVPTGARSG
jgi:tetratricopeptide (TPR) repeat protein